MVYNVSLLQTPIGQQQFQYFTKLNETLVGANIASTGFTCGNNGASMTVDRYICFSILSLLATAVIFATIYDMGSSISSLDQNQQSDWISGFVNTFSVTRNVGFVFEPRRDSSYACFDGLRAISMLWIILGHSIAVQASVGYLNPATVLPPAVRVQPRYYGYYCTCTS